MLLAATMDVYDRGRFTLGFGYFLPWKNQVAETLKEKGAEVNCFGGSSNLVILFKSMQLASFLKKWRAQVLHCHLPWAGIAGRIAGKLAEIPVVYTEHNKQERYHPVTRWLNKATFSWQKSVIAVSEDVANSIYQNIGRRTPVHVIPNGINTENYRPGDEQKRVVRRQLSIPDECKVIGMVAVFRLQKRLDLWLRVAAAVKKTMGNVKFVLVGDGPCRPMVEETIAALGLRDDVRLLGIQVDPRPFYNCFDLFLMTSEFEGLPVALLEAMAMRVPTVATNAGGIGEVITHDREGLLFPVDADAATISAGCVSVLLDDHRRAACGDRARQRVLDQFSIEKMTAGVEKVYLDVLSKK